MNKLSIIGNLVRDPESRMTQSGHSVCSFTVAVSRRRKDGQDQGADFFRVSAWNKLGEHCQKFLSKGKKVAVTGSVSVSTFKDKNGEVKANMDVMANEVEFLTPTNTQREAPSGEYVEVSTDDLPF